MHLVETNKSEEKGGSNKKQEMLIMNLKREFDAALKLLS